MKTINFIEKLKNSPLVIFRISDISRILGKSREYTSLYLYRLKEKNHILEVEKGKYALKDSNIYSVASNILPFSYISFLSALSYYKITAQIPNKITIVSTKSKKPLRFQNYDIEFVKYSREKIIGIKKEISNNKPIFIAKPEKAIVDSLYLPRYCPIDEVENAIAEADIDVDEITKLAIKMNSIVLLKRLGFVLEKNKMDIHDRISSRLNNRYDLLNPYAKPKGTLNKKWRLVINE